MSHPGAQLTPHPASPAPPTVDRRPLASRRSRLINRLAAALAARRISPNFISLVGLGAGIGAGVALWLTSAAPAFTDQLVSWQTRLLFLAAAALVQLRLLCNLVDGLVAVEGNMRSPVGDLFNEVPDRVSDAAGLIGAGLAITGKPWLGLLAAIAAILTAYIRALGKGLTGVNDYRGPMAKPQRMALLTFACLFLALAPLSWWPVLSIRGHTWGPLAIVLAIITLGSLLTCINRLNAIAATLQTRAAKSHSTTSNDTPTTIP